MGQQPVHLRVLVLAVHFASNILPLNIGVPHILTLLHDGFQLNNNLSKRPFVTSLCKIVTHLWSSPLCYYALFCVIFSNNHHLIYFYILFKYFFLFLNTLGVFLV